MWALASGSCLLGVDTEKLCQRQAALETSDREKPDAWQRKNQNRRPGLGAPTTWAQEDPHCSPICFWQLVFGQPSYSGTLYSSQNQVSEGYYVISSQLGVTVIYLVPCPGVFVRREKKKERKRGKETTSMRNQKQSLRSARTFPPPHLNPVQLLVTIGRVSLLHPKIICSTWSVAAISSHLLKN